MATDARTDAYTDDLAGRLLLAVNGLSHRLRTRAPHDDLTPTRMITLATVAEHGPLRIGDLAERVGTAAPTMSRLVEWLAEHRLVTRAPDETDLRVNNVAISATGATVLAELRGRRTGYLAERIGRLSPEQVASLVDALALLEDFAAGSTP